MFTVELFKNIAWGYIESIWWFGIIIAFSGRMSIFTFFVCKVKIIKNRNVKWNNFESTQGGTVNFNSRIKFSLIYLK